MKFPIHLILMSAMYLFPAVTGFSNEIRNGDFKMGLQGWLIQRDGEVSLMAQEAESYCRFADGGVEINVRAIKVSAEKPADVILIQYLDQLQKGTDYTLTMDIKVPADEKVIYGLGLGIQSGPNKHNLGGAVRLTELVGTGNWTQVKAHFRWDPSEAKEHALEGDPGASSIQFRIGLTPNIGIRNVKLAK